MFKKIKKGIKVLKEEGLRIFLFKTANFVKVTIRPLYIKFFVFRNKEKVMHKLRNFSSDDNQKVFDYIFFKYLGVFAPMQIREEFLELLKIFKEIEPKIMVEIGTANGGTFFCFSKLAPDDATIISIDLPEGKFSGGYPEWKIPIFKSFTVASQKMFLLRQDSHAQETINKVKDILNKRSVDFLFIDGDHSYEGVKKDFEMYSPLVKSSGIIAFHDIISGSEENIGGVPAFWREIESKYQTVEFIKDLNQGGCGIGLIVNH